MLTKQGAKLLDFGLAAVTSAKTASVMSALPTTPPKITQRGTIMGTFQYMAPEQVEGEDADARSDIFAYGAVVFEMLTGRPAFQGKTHAIVDRSDPARRTRAGDADRAARAAGDQPCREDLSREGSRRPVPDDARCVASVAVGDGWWIAGRSPRACFRSPPCARARRVELGGGPGACCDRPRRVVGHEAGPCPAKRHAVRDAGARRRGDARRSPHLPERPGGCVQRDRLHRHDAHLDPADVGGGGAATRGHRWNDPAVLVA